MRFEKLPQYAYIYIYIYTSNSREEECVHGDGVFLR